MTVEQQPEIDLFGSKRWYNNDGELHREDGPALELFGGNKFWFINGKRHRIDKPAEEYFDGSNLWYVDGKLHRIDGPAVKLFNGYEEFWIDGEQYDVVKFNQIVDFPEIAIPYINFSNSIYHIKFREEIGIRLSYILELYNDGKFIKWDWSLGEVILGFVQNSNCVEPLLDWIQENSKYFPSEFIERLFYQ
jgi:hypothetical protein